MVGRTLGELRLRRRYGVYVLAVHRRSQNIGRQLDDLVVQVGDTLLLEGAHEDIQRLAADVELVDISHPSQKAYRRAQGAHRHRRRWLSVVVLSSLDVAPILALAFLAVAVILVTRCIDSGRGVRVRRWAADGDDLRDAGRGGGAGAVGRGRLIVTAVRPWMEGLSPFAMILAVYLLGLILTEFLSNNAVAVIYTPIAIQLAQSLGVDPRPFVVAVMFSATLAFATPIGYQTNMMVYGPGGYRFLDFTKIGVPLNIITWLLCSALIPLIWPLHP